MYVATVKWAATRNGYKILVKYSFQNVKQYWVKKKKKKNLRKPYALMTLPWDTWTANTRQVFSATSNNNTRISNGLAVQSWEHPAIVDSIYICAQIMYAPYGLTWMRPSIMRRYQSDCKHYTITNYKYRPTVTSWPIVINTYPCMRQHIRNSSKTVSRPQLLLHHSQHNKKKLCRIMACVIPVTTGQASPRRKDVKEVCEVLTHYLRDFGSNSLV